MTLQEVIDAASGYPLLLAILVGAGGVLAVIERLFALAGPITKLKTWWEGRELAKLRREALLRAERRRIEQEEADARVAALTEEVTWLRAEVERMRTVLRDATGVDTAPMRSTRNRPRVPEPRR